MQRASTLKNSSFNVVLLKYLWRMIAVLGHSKSICLTVKWHLQWSQTGWLSLDRSSGVTTLEAPWGKRFLGAPRILANVNSRSCTPVRLSFVCLLSVTFVHRTQSVEIFGNVSTLLAILSHPQKFLRRSSQGRNPSVRVVKRKRGSQIERFWTYQTLYLGNSAR